MDPVVGTPDGDERLTQIAQGGLTRVFNVPFSYQHAHEPWLLQLAEGVATKGVVVDAPFRLLGQLNLGDQGARRRLPSGELDAGRLADHAAPSVAPDEVVRPEGRAVGELHVDAGVLLREPRHVT